MEANRFKGLTNGGRNRTAEMSAKDQLLARLTGQINDFHHPGKPTPPQSERRQATPVEIQKAISINPPESTSNNRIHPNTPSDWRIPDLPPSRRKTKRQNGKKK